MTWKRAWSIWFARTPPPNARAICGIVDASGEDYLYPESYFVFVDLPEQARECAAGSEIMTTDGRSEEYSHREWYLTALWHAGTVLSIEMPRCVQLFLGKVVQSNEHGIYYFN